MENHDDQVTGSRIVRIQELFEWKDSRTFLIIGGLSLFVFWPCVLNQFVPFDDDQYVYANPHVMSGVSHSNLVWAVTDVETCYWIPVTWISHQIDCQAFSLKPSGHHLTSVWLHVAVSILAYILALKLQIQRRPALIGALVFAFHPTNVEVVAWVSERKTILATAFLLMATILHLSFLARPRALLKLGVFIMFIFAVMSKPIAVIFPVVLVCIDWLYSGKFSPRVRNGLTRSANCPGLEQKQFLILERLTTYVPFFLVSIGVGVITVFSQSNLGLMPSITSLPIDERLATMAINYFSYASMFVFPYNLCCVYPMKVAPSFWEALVGIAFVLAIIRLAIYYHRRAPLYGLALFWFLIYIVLVSGLVQSGYQQRADRYLYTASIVPSLAVAQLLYTWLRNRPKLGTCVALCILAMEVAITHYQIRTWRNDSTLFEKCLSAGYDSAVAYNNLGVVESRRGNHPAAFVAFRKALAKDCQNPFPWANLGVLERELKRPGRSALYFEEAAKLTGNPAIIADYAEALARSGRIREAVKQYRKAIKADPDSLKACADLSLLLSSSSDDGVRRPAESFALSEHAVRLTMGQSLEALTAHAAAQASLKDFSNAIASIQAAKGIAQSQRLTNLVKELARITADYKQEVASRTNMPLRGKLGQ